MKCPHCIDGIMTIATDNQGEFWICDICQSTNDTEAA